VLDEYDYRIMVRAYEQIYYAVGATTLADVA
jgi:hypothetical protein